MMSVKRLELSINGLKGQIGKNAYSDCTAVGNVTTNATATATAIPTRRLTNTEAPTFNKTPEGVINQAMRKQGNWRLGDRK